MKEGKGERERERLDGGGEKRKRRDENKNIYSFKEKTVTKGYEETGWNINGKVIHLRYSVISIF